jgi:hypothetical protein
MGRKDYTLAGEASFRDMMYREEERRRWFTVGHRWSGTNYGPNIISLRRAEGKRPRQFAPAPHTVNNVVCLATYRAARLARRLGNGKR